MNEPWFDPIWSWLPGTSLGVSVGIFGAFVGFLAPKGKAKPIVMGVYFAFVAISLALLIAGIVAVCIGQPYHVWYGLLLAGLIGSLILGGNYWTLANAYAMAERRRIEASDL